jgi:hypothetical protein
MHEYYTKFLMRGIGSDPGINKVSKFGKVPLMEVNQEKIVKGIIRIHNTSACLRAVPLNRPWSVI